MALTARAGSSSSIGLLEGDALRPGVADEPESAFGVLERRRDSSRALHRRQAKLLCGLGVLLVVGALAVTAAAHTFVASDQQRIDSLQVQLTQALAEQQDLQIFACRARVSRASAQHRRAHPWHGQPGFGLLFSPVNPGPSVEQTQASLAKAALKASTGRSGSSSSAGSASSGAENAKTGKRSSTGGRSSAISSTG